MDDLMEAERADGTGNVLAVPENPVLEAPSNGTRRHGHELNVEANFSMARDPEGARCINVGRRLFLTPAEAHMLAIDLTEAADNVGETRRRQGFDN